MWHQTQPRVQRQRRLSSSARRGSKRYNGQKPVAVNGASGHGLAPDRSHVLTGYRANISDGPSRASASRWLSPSGLTAYQRDLRDINMTTYIIMLTIQDLTGFTLPYMFAKLSDGASGVALDAPPPVLSNTAYPEPEY